MSKINKYYLFIILNKNNKYYEIFYFKIGEEFLYNHCST